MLNSCHISHKDHLCHHKDHLSHLQNRHFPHKDHLFLHKNHTLATLHLLQKQIRDHLNLFQMTHLQILMENL